MTCLEPGMRLARCAALQRRHCGEQWYVQVSQPMGQKTALSANKKEASVLPYPRICEILGCLYEKSCS